jgi:hypothetical protein
MINLKNLKEIKTGEKEISKELIDAFFKLKKADIIWGSITDKNIVEKSVRNADFVFHSSTWYLSQKICFDFRSGRFDRRIFRTKCDVIWSYRKNVLPGWILGI